MNFTYFSAPVLLNKIYLVLAIISKCCFNPEGKFSCVTYPCPLLKLKKTFVHLTCVKHTASIYPEPGSNFLIISWMSLFKDF